MRFNLPNFNDCDCLCPGTGTGTGTIPTTPTCSSCDDVPPCWFVDLSGINTNTPPNLFCDSLCAILKKGLFGDGLWPVAPFHPCSWRYFCPIDRFFPPIVPECDAELQSAINGCCGSGLSQLIISVGNFNTPFAPPHSQCIWFVSISLQCLHQGVVMATYRVDNCDYNCDGPLILNKIPPLRGEFGCDWPDTIRIIPNRTCLGTDTGTGTGTTGPPPACDTFICIWEWTTNTHWRRIFYGCPNFSDQGDPFIICDCVADPPITGNEKNGDQVFRACNVPDIGT